LVEEVTERKQMIQALRESEAKYRRLFESMTDAFVKTDMTGRIVEFNPSFQALVGYSADELVRLTYVDLTPEKWRAFEAQLVAEQVLVRGHSNVYEKEYHHRDGAVFPVELRTFLLRDADGRPAGMWAIVRDITLRQQAEEALRQAHDTLEARVKERTTELQAANAALTESEERYRSLVNNLTVGVYRNKPGLQGGFVQANFALARLHGYDSVEELQKVRVADLYQDPRDRGEFLANLKRQGTLRNYEVRLKKKDGTPIDASVNATAQFGPNGEIDWIDGMLEDITERKKAEEALRVSEERYRTLAESSPDAIFILDRDIRVQYVNSTAAALWRRQPKDLIGLTQAELFPSEAAQRQSRVVRNVIEMCSTVRREMPQAFPVGDQWIEVRLAPLFDAQGKVTSVMGIARNITERKRAEQQLSEALDLNQKMIAASPMGISAFKASGECVFANDASARILGGSLSEVREDNFRRLEAWRDCGLLQLADEVLSHGQGRSGEVSRTTRFGKTISLDCHLAPFVSNGQPHLLFMALDISERKRAEEALKMQSLVLQNMAEGALLVGPDQTILFANSALESMFRYEPGELIGRQVSALNAWPPEETARFNAAVMRATEAGGVWLGQYENRRKDGTLFTSESRVIRLTLGGQDHFISVQQDVTERKLAESLLRAQRDVGVSLSLTSDMTMALKHLLDIAVQIGGLDCGGVYLLNPYTQELALAARHGLSDSFVRWAAHFSADSPQAKLVEQGRSVFDTYQNLPVHHNATGLREGLRAIAIIPLSHNRRIIGALNLASHTAEEIPAQARIVIETIAAQAAGAIARIGAETERHRLEHQLLEISDREHARMGQDIHDGLCQHLVSLAFDANSLRSQLAAAHRPEAKTASRIADYLDQAITETRQLSRGLFPVRLAREGLPSALEELAEATRERFKIPCRFASAGPVAVESSIVATHLYRIAQEAVSNAVKHSRAKSIGIRLRARGGVLELSVADDGQGLSAGRRKEATGMGLHIIEYRARTIGGDVRIGPGRRGGTKVSCCVPTHASGRSTV
jgi:PAS domain S-box-containing protein